MTMGHVQAAITEQAQRAPGAVQKKKKKKSVRPQVARVTVHWTLPCQFWTFQPRILTRQPHTHVQERSSIYRYAWTGSRNARSGTFFSIDRVEFPPRIKAKRFQKNRNICLRRLHAMVHAGEQSLYIQTRARNGKAA